MDRTALAYLRAWKDKPSRKPLVLRGARQVGKSYLVRMLAAEVFDNLIEINLETDPDAPSLFASKDPRTIVPLLARATGQLHKLMPVR